MTERTMKTTERIQGQGGPGRGPFGGPMIGQKSLAFGTSAKRLCADCGLRWQG